MGVEHARRARCPTTFLLLRQALLVTALSPMGTNKNFRKLLTLSLPTATACWPRTLEKTLTGHHLWSLIVKKQSIKVLFAQVPANKDAVLRVLCGAHHITNSETEFQSGDAATIAKARLKSFTFLPYSYFHSGHVFFSIITRANR